MNQKFLDMITDFIFVEHAPEYADLIMVPGNGYPQMAERAAELYHQGYAPLILPSGRYSIRKGCFEGVRAKQQQYDGSYETEWEFLAAVLQSCRVPAEVILREDRGTFTYENAICSRQVTDSLELEVRKAILCCKSYHARRCLLYYQLLYPQTEFCVCAVDADGITRDNWFLREDGIELVLGELERCGGQFHQILHQMRKENF